MSESRTPKGFRNGVDAVLRSAYKAIERHPVPERLTDQADSLTLPPPANRRDKRN